MFFVYRLGHCRNYGSTIGCFNCITNIFLLISLISLSKIYITPTKQLARPTRSLGQSVCVGETERERESSSKKMKLN